VSEPGNPSIPARLRPALTGSEASPDEELLVQGFRAWLRDGPERSTITFSKAGGSVTATAATVHGSALELLSRFAAQTGTGRPLCQPVRTS